MAKSGAFHPVGETWRRVSPEAMPGIPSIVTHPLSMGTAEFKQFLTDLQERGVLPQGILTQDRQETVKIALPTVLEAGVPLPQHSAGEPAEAYRHLSLVGGRMVLRSGGGFGVSASFTLGNAEFWGNGVWGRFALLGLCGALEFGFAGAG
uniref:Uncharacterized protein n=1 Tax=Desertifilum tharense IPPAS B-1220 TaxID=1781255 RepID=A0ACD5H2F1_9CYAN